MDANELTTNLIVQDGRETLKVSTINKNQVTGAVVLVTASVVLPVPPRTTVRSYTPSEILDRWRPVSDAKYNEYCEAYRNPAARP